MKNKFLNLYIIFIMHILGCNGAINIQDEALIIAKDNQITKEEFFNLQKQVTKESKYAKYKNSSELYNYLIKLFKAKNMGVKVYNPEVKKEEPFAVNFYFENSLSMDGYITNADLKSSLFDILTNTKKITNTINRNYINEKVINISLDNQAFSTGLTPSSFNKLGGNRGNSDIAEVVKNVLSKTNQKNMSVLISDFVFSPPVKTNAKDYLNIQQTAIKGAIQDKLKNQNLALAIFQMSALFDGKYYSYKFPAGKQFSGMRPYYVWFIGTEDQIKKVLDNQIVDPTSNKFLNVATFYNSKKAKIPDYKITTKEIGDFKPKDKHSLYNATSEQKEFSFNVAVNFSNSIKGLEYFNNNSIYASDNYSISVRGLSQKEKKQIGLSTYTHILTLKTTRLQTEKLVVKVANRHPAWVLSSSSTDDQNITTDKIEQTKTFGLNNLITGVWQGFNYYSNPDDNIITQLTINIEK
ncbi:hypothetical protein ASE92_20135 [Pedobacter sp. Leaf41]|uniref:hypothetical protein n=1 Tax=Pedobacter sp. Leaf41 TaxID=1736218 RepID=UPI000702A483|nr:hypothetical protein [Pedobacter sp. Leaf41]KQN37248.1 hypothetical protein ASE92_20135 [Pedobacter sp. Leaf41]